MVTLKWLGKLSGLQRLRCVLMTDDIEVDDVTKVGHETKMDDEVKDNRSPMLSFNGTLISLKVEKQKRTSHWPRFVSTCQLPKSLQKLTLSKVILESNDFSIIGKAVPHLEVFKISYCLVPSEWNVDDEDFPELKVLKLRNLKISKWTTSEDSFRTLEQLWLDGCVSLDEIPLEFGSLQKLRIISVKDCPPSVDDSAREIEKEQHEQQNTEMRVHISVHISKPYSRSTYKGL